MKNSVKVVMPSGALLQIKSWVDYQGSLEFKESDTYFYRMTGELSLENNGGFIQFRTKIEDHPSDKSFRGVRLRVRGNNNEYTVHIRTKIPFFTLAIL